MAAAISQTPQTLSPKPHSLQSFTVPQPLMTLQSTACPCSYGDLPAMSSLHLYSAQPQTAYLQAQSGNKPASQQPEVSPLQSQSWSVFDRLHRAPSEQQQASVSGSQPHRSQTPTLSNPSQASHGTHDLPPGFASPDQQQLAGPGDFPPGFKSPRSSMPPASALHSRLRSDHMVASTQPEQTSSRSAESAQAAPGQGAPPSGPPGFGSLPAYMAQRLSPSPAQKSAELTNQVWPRAASNSPEHINNPGAGQNGRQHLPAAAYDASSDESSDEEPPGFSRANATAGQREPAPRAGPSGPSVPKHSSQALSQTQRAHPPGYSTGSTAPPDHNGTHQVGICFTSLQFNCAACTSRRPSFQWTLTSLHLVLSEMPDFSCRCHV